MTEYELMCIEQASTCISQANRDFTLNCIIFIVTFISAIIVYLDYRHRKRKEEAEKSIQIAEEFAKEIIAAISIINDFFEDNKINLIINKITFIRFRDFDSEELYELYSALEVSNYSKLFSEKDSNYKVRMIITKTLNRLEYMCMNISAKVANEKYIYNSLHQQFLKTISLLYFEISLINTDNKDKYYTNIINVYNIWKKKYLKIAKKEGKIKEKYKTKLLPQNPRI